MECSCQSPLAHRPVIQPSAPGGWEFDLGRRGQFFLAPPFLQKAQMPKRIAHLPQDHRGLT